LKKSKKSLRERYGHLFSKLSGLSHTSGTIDETNVYQEANKETRKFMDAIVEENLLEGSRLEGRENFKNFLEQVKSGKHGLILTEHYSNMDLPILCYILEHDKDDFGAEISRRIVAISGKKLNEDNPVVRSLAEAFTRIVIYPSRSLGTITDAQEELRGKKINMAAMRALNDIRRSGKIVLVFPSGTRYRPCKPETKRGLREIDSYLRLFDVMILVSINGLVMRISDENPDDMTADLIVPDKVIVSASEVLDCKQFRKDVIDSLAADAQDDPKQAIIDRAMQMLEVQHNAYGKLV
jgi:glycerol-3-phosphate O-acyltransferase